MFHLVGYLENDNVFHIISAFTDKTFTGR